ncbi:M48 family metallopeptidase [Wenxinia marina]|uniref:Peptidase family M48 n=1 Tax=Wenxinia marina DSM 24838 TaxID=1123501 RepID=A0A0D0NMU3_9RHOB|nr:M48 family metallopeptidase [Wenxinia marina]KIQ69615.1 Peptidase family M48 [Wenxinia marina DSM 24838]GGL59758.1 peptidase M48 [Wenxinia marina]
MIPHLLRPSCLCLAVVATLAACARAPEPVAPGDVVVTGPRQGQERGDAAPALPPTAIREAARSFVAVVAQVEPVAEAVCRERSPQANCDFEIVVDDRPGVPPNAFQFLDRRGRPVIAFTLSLILDAANRDELAFVMSHEAAHHIEGHLARQREIATLGAAVFGQLAGAGGGNSDAIRTAQELGAAVGARTYSREFELEADALGTIIAARAGYDPLRGSEFFFRLPDPGDRFLGTHPPNAERLAVVRAAVAGL